MYLTTLEFSNVVQAMYYWIKAYRISKRHVEKLEYVCNIKNMYLQDISDIIRGVFIVVVFITGRFRRKLVFHM